MKKIFKKYILNINILILAYMLCIALIHTYISSNSQQLSVGLLSYSNFIIGKDFHSQYLIIPGLFGASSLWLKEIFLIVVGFFALDLIANKNDYISFAKGKLMKFSKVVVIPLAVLFSLALISFFADANHQRNQLILRLAEKSNIIEIVEDDVESSIKSNEKAILLLKNSRAVKEDSFAICELARSVSKIVSFPVYSYDLIYGENDYTRSLLEYKDNIEIPCLIIVENGCVLDILSGRDTTNSMVDSFRQGDLDVKK